MTNFIRIFFGIVDVDTTTLFHCFFFLPSIFSCSAAMTFGEAHDTVQHNTADTYGYYRILLLYNVSFVQFIITYL